MPPRVTKTANGSALTVLPPSVPAVAETPPAPAHTWPVPVRAHGAAKIARALDDAARFEALCEFTEKGDVLWKGSAPLRRPLFHLGKQTISARRAAYLLYVSEIPRQHNVVSSAKNPLDVSPWKLEVERAADHPSERHNRRRRTARVEKRKAAKPADARRAAKRGKVAKRRRGR